MLLLDGGEQSGVVRRGGHHRRTVLLLPVDRAVQRAAPRRALAQVPRDVRVVLGVVRRQVLGRVVARVPGGRGLSQLGARGPDPVARFHGGVPVGPDLRRGHPLLLLPPVAEPDPDDLLLQLEAVRQGGDLLRRGLWVLLEYDQTHLIRFSNEKLKDL